MSRDGAAAHTRSDSAKSQPSADVVVDSALPIDEALGRFREGLARVTRLEGGARTRDELVARFVGAVERGDTTALRRLELSRAEFAFLVYPSSIYTRPPFQQSPSIVWMLQRAGGRSGYRRLVQRYGGRPLGYGGYRCAESSHVQEANRLWGNCAITFRNAYGEPASGRLFGAIIEREGRFKFVSYANDL